MMVSPGGGGGCVGGMDSKKQRKLTAKHTARSNYLLLTYARFKPHEN